MIKNILKNFPFVVKAIGAKKSHTGPDIDQRAQDDHVDHSQATTDDNASDHPHVTEKAPRKGFAGKFVTLFSRHTNVDREAVNANHGHSSPEEVEKVTLISGENAFITLDNHPFEDMVKIAERRTFSPFNRGFYRRASPKLSVYTYPEVQSQHSKVRLAVDGYLKLGMKRSLSYKEGPVIVLGGDADDEGTNLEILVFFKGQVLSVSEKQLPHRNAHDFHEVFESIMESIKQQHANARFIQAAPLERVTHQDIYEYADHEIFKRIPLTDLQPSDSPVKLYGPALTIAGLSLVYYTYILVSGYNQHARLTDEVIDLQRQLRSLTQNEVSIEVLEAREQFKLHNEKEVQTESQVSHIEALAQAVGSIPGGQIRRIRTPGDAGTVAQLTIAVPEGDYDSPLIHGRDLLDSLVYNSNGYSMRLSQNRGSVLHDDVVVFSIEVINGQ